MEGLSGRMQMAGGYKKAKVYIVRCYTCHWYALEEDFDLAFDEDHPPCPTCQADDLHIDDIEGWSTVFYFPPTGILSDGDPDGRGDSKVAASLVENPPSVVTANNKE